jgi:hypothetical protein
MVERDASRYSTVKRPIFVNLLILLASHHPSRTDVEFSMNLLGLRNDEVGEKGERDYRILVLGDSITLGGFAEAGEIYPAVNDRENFCVTHPVAEGDWRSIREDFDALIADCIGDWRYAWSADFWPKIVPLLEFMEQSGDERGFRLAVLLFPISYQLQGELQMDEPQRAFDRHMMGLSVRRLICFRCCAKNISRTA